MKLKSAPKDVLQDFIDQYVDKKIAAGERPRLVGGYEHYYPDDSATKCGCCAVTLFVRPQIAVLAGKYKLKIYCRRCIGEKEYAEAAAKLEEAFNEALCKDGCAK